MGRMEETVMKNNHAKIYPPLHRGICCGCDHVLICQLHREEDEPVFFCEEFSCAPQTPRHSRPKLYSLPGGCAGATAVEKSDKARATYIGLCRTCSQLSTCLRLKPGGGTWQCDTYEEDPAC